MTNTIETQLNTLATSQGISINQLLIEKGISEVDLDQAYDDMLNEVYPVTSIGHCTFFPSRILEQLDVTAYRCGYSDYVDSYFYDNDDYISFDNGESFFVLAEVERLIEDLEQEENN